MDVHIFLTLLSRGWSVLAGGGTALLIPAFLTPAQQGYYYTFASVLAAQIFFELGLNHVLTQLTSHTAAHLRRDSQGALTGEPRWLQSLASLLALSARWNAIMATLFFAAAVAGGGYFFSRKGTLPTMDWLAPWVALIVATALNLAMSARLAICEGLGEVGQVARLRINQSMVGYAVLWVLLFAHQGLWAAVAVPAASAVIAIVWLGRHATLSQLREAAASAKDTDGEHRYTWRRDIFPLQWRIALSWMSGYFIFNFLTPIVFAKQGPVDAGRLGLAHTIFWSILTLGISWVSAKVPALSAHIARHERTELNTLFDQVARRTVGITALCVTTFVLVVEVAGQFMPAVLHRIPPVPALLMMAAATIANAAIFAMAVYMRAHKEEPLLAQSLVTAVLVAVGAYGMADHSLTAAVGAYCGVTLIVALPWVTLIYKKYRRRTA
ncbi:MAG: hypothetical protein J7598_18825 [Mitsuaria chitosanitabida]|uniref:hypothetical protein n=1 Tax=Roseateles chitosanitabidus TaxID=65048 RepID=UPI001B0242E1|nr:hypothetical protein [Roseateles chitosanitabidus]MBO9688660.1 hypothetical protein [Roseateles chitosanitabidus]